ncbi:MAG: permease [Clostridiales bacterium 38-18]|nr:MAG: permease [Clostridiales bacterium 38-18]
MRLSFRIALRFLLSNKGQTFLILLGIAIGISVQIFIGSLIQGLQASLLDATIGSSPHITISASEKNTPMDKSQQLIQSVKNSDATITSLSDSITVGAFIKTGDRSEQVVVRGFDFNLSNAIYKFDERLDANSQLPANDHEVIIGKGIADAFDLSKGDTIKLLSVDGTTVNATIAGVFDLKVAAINQSWVLGTKALARDITGYTDDQVSEIELQIEAPFDADQVSATIASNINNSDIKVVDWKSQNEQLLSGLSGQSTSSLMIQVFVVISVVLGIASVLAISVMQKSRQLGILKAMGINDAMASTIFLSQGVLLGLGGAVLGILFGFGLLYSFTTFALNPDGTPVVPILISPSFIALSGAIAVIASTTASLIPALKSRKLSPMEVIKNG